MTEARHVVRRQTLEVVVADPVIGKRALDELGAIQRQVIVPILDNVCSELAPAGSLVRIPHLEIDLGSVASLDLRSSIMRSLPHRLAEALSQAIQAEGFRPIGPDVDPAGPGSGANTGPEGMSRAGTVPEPEAAQRLGSGDDASVGTSTPLDSASVSERDQIDRHVELVMYYCRTGMLPWWVDRSAPTPVAASVAVILERAPGSTRQLLLAIGGDDRAVRRLVAALPTDLLRSLIGLSADPSLRVPLPFILDVLATTAAGPETTTDDRRLRTILTKLLLAALRESPPEPIDLLSATITEWPDRDPTIPRELIDTVWRIVDRLGPDDMADAATLTAAVIARVDLPEGEPAVIFGRVVFEAMARRLWEAPLAVRILTVLAEGHPAPGSPDRSAMPDDRSIGVGVDTAPGLHEARRNSELRGQAVSTSQPDLWFADSEVALVANAGLVILAPFLQRLFTQRGLLADDGRSFVDRPAQDRAAHLLQFMANGDEEPAEYDLTLNKVLCGLSPAEDIDPERRVTEPDIDACLDLIYMVLDLATGLGRLSIDGLRGSFLVRDGALSADAGRWLLRVERLTHDLLLDRLAWSFDVIHLPWMTDPLVVEW